MNSNMSNYSFRLAILDDIASLLPLLKTLFSIEEDFAFDEQKQRRGLELLLEKENAAVMVALDGNTIIGMVTGQLLISTAQGGYSLLVEDMVVLATYRRKKIATLLLENLSIWAMQNGASRMQLLADKDNNTGLKFYASSKWLSTNLICLKKFIKAYPQLNQFHR